MTISNLPFRATLTLFLMVGIALPGGYGPAKADDASDVKSGNGDQTTPQTADVNSKDGDAHRTAAPPHPLAQPKAAAAPATAPQTPTGTSPTPITEKSNIPTARQAPSATTKVVSSRPVTLGPRSGPRIGRRRSIEGTASYYGSGFHGRRTASGERFNMNAMTLACRRLPLGTRVRVTNLRNGRSVVGRVNDLGPNGRFRRTRVADLSRGMARKIGFNDGLTKVRLEVVK